MLNSLLDAFRDESWPAVGPENAKTFRDHRARLEDLLSVLSVELRFEMWPVQH